MALYGNLKANNLIYNLDDGAGDVSVALSQVGDKAPLASPTFTGDVTINNQGDLRLYDSGSSHYIGVQAPANVAANLVWTLPGADGSSGQLLQTDGSGTLSWSTTDLSGYALKSGDTFTGAVIVTNDVTVNGQNELRLGDSDSSHYVGFKGPDDISANTIWKLPTGDGTNGQLLQTNGSGVLSWSTTDLSSYAPLASPALTGNATADNLTISGNLTINGTQTTVDTTNLIVDDPLMMLARNNSAADTVDIGFYGQYHLSGAGVYGGLFRDATDSKWKLFANNGTIPTTTVDTTDAGYAAATLVVGTLEDSKGDVRTIPKITKSSAYTPADTSDVGKVIFISTGGVTINNSIYAAGDVITIINDSGSDQTITQGSATIYNTSDASTGNRTLAGRGMATIWFAAHNEAYISGSGLS